MGKLEINKQIKQNALYNTAFELFTTKGISKTTISDIVEKAGVAKGTFYLYFKDKLDIRDKLVTHKAEELLREACQAMQEQNVTGFVSQIHFLVDNIVDRLQENPSLLVFIHKNLSWGIFKTILNDNPSQTESDFYRVFLALLHEDPDAHIENPDFLLFSIIELVSGTCFHCIVYQQPASLDAYRPYLHKIIDAIILAG